MGQEIEARKLPATRAVFSAMWAPIFEARLMVAAKKATQIAFMSESRGGSRCDGGVTPMGDRQLYLSRFPSPVALMGAGDSPETRPVTWRLASRTVGVRKRSDNRLSTLAGPVRALPVERSAVGAAWATEADDSATAPARTAPDTMRARLK